MACSRLVFYATADIFRACTEIRKEGTEWHLYGDTRWPAPNIYIEFNGFFGQCGLLVMRVEIADVISNPFDWVAENVPLQEIFPSERSTKAVSQRQEMLNYQAESTEIVPGPEDTKPRSVQSYCFYRAHGDVKLVARYTDLLNAEGIPIQKYRMASVQSEDIDFCRSCIHALFSLNKARIAGLPFISIPQLESCEPVSLPPDNKAPRWVHYHPSRVLRTRPAVHALPTPDTMVEGKMRMNDFQRVMEVRRLEMNLHNLAFDRDARLHRMPHEDSNSTMAAFTHRANGGAIYVIPDRLVEEFDNTDCEEIRMTDLKLPFATLFLKFTPPQTLFLAEGAPVDGCYLAKHGGEYLLTLTSYWEDVDYARSLSVACQDPTFSIHLPAPSLTLDEPGKEIDICVNEAVEQGIQTFLSENAPPTDNFSQEITRPDGYYRIHRGRACQKAARAYSPIPFAGTNIPRLPEHHH